MKFKARVIVTATIELNTTYYKADDQKAVCQEQQAYWDDDYEGLIDCIGDGIDEIKVEPLEVE